MTPKEKALELYKKFRNEYPVLAANARAKQCALIAVDEIQSIYYRLTDEYNFWQQVKTEIENL